MYSITDPQVARLQIDERIRDAEVRRIARAIRREARTQPASDSSSRVRRVWPVRTWQRAFA
jgi:hypothetical protein